MLIPPIESNQNYHRQPPQFSRNPRVGEDCLHLPLTPLVLIPWCCSILFPCALSSFLYLLSLPCPEPHVADPPFAFSKGLQHKFISKNLKSNIKRTFQLYQHNLTSCGALTNLPFFLCSLPHSFLIFSHLALPPTCVLITVFRQSISSLPLFNLSLSKSCFGRRRPPFIFASPPSPPHPKKLSKYFPSFLHQRDFASGFQGENMFFFPSRPRTK